MTTKSVARWVVLAALFLIPFLALYVSDGLYFPFITGKNFGFRILVGTAFVAWIVLAIADARYRPKASVVLYAFAGFVAWMALANALAVNPHKAFWSNYERMEGWVTLAHAFVLFIVAGSVLAVGNLWRRWWLAFIASSALVCGYGLLQLSGAIRAAQGVTRLDATLGNAIYLALFLFFALAVTFWQALESRGALRWALVALMPLQLLTLFSTGTRGVFVGLVAAIGIGGLLWIATAKGTARRIGAGIGIGLLLAGAGLYVIRDASFIQSNYSLSRIANISLADLGTRSAIWEMAVQGVRERPLFGWGQEGFNYVFNTYYDPALYDQEPWFDRAHNVYLDWAIAGGIPALLLFLLLLGSGVFLIARARALDRTTRIILIAAIAGYAVQALVVFDNLFAYVPLAVLLAFAHAHAARPVAALSRAREPDDQTLAPVGVPIALVLGGVLLWFVNVPGIRAAGLLIDGLMPANAPAARVAALRAASETGGFATQEVAEQAMQLAVQAVNDPAVPDRVRADAFALAQALMAAEVARAPQDARLRLQYGMLLRAAGDLDAAAAQLEAARRLSPRKQQIIQEAGILALQRQDYAAAEARFREAYELETRNQDAAAYVAAARVFAGDPAGAQAVLRAAFGTTTVGHPLLVSAYYRTRNWDGLLAVLQARYAELRDPSIGFQIVAAYAEAGRAADARAAVERVMRDFPDRPDVQAQGRAALEQLMRL